MLSAMLFHGPLGPPVEYIRVTGFAARGNEPAEALQVMFCCWRMTQDSPPSGAVTVTAGGVAATMLKTALLVSAPLRPSVSSTVTRMQALVVVAAGRLQAYGPPFGRPEATVDQGPPQPAEEY